MDQHQGEDSNFGEADSSTFKENAEWQLVSKRKPPTKILPADLHDLSNPTIIKLGKHWNFIFCHLP